MNHPFSTSASMPVRRRFVADLLTVTQNTALAPTLREQLLLAQYVHGELVLEQVLMELEEGEGKVKK